MIDPRGIANQQAAGFKHAQAIASSAATYARTRRLRVITACVENMLDRHKKLGRSIATIRKRIMPGQKYEDYKTWHLPFDEYAEPLIVIQRANIIAFRLAKLSYAHRFDEYERAVQLTYLTEEHRTLGKILRALKRELKKIEKEHEEAQS